VLVTWQPGDVPAATIVLLADAQLARGENGGRSAGRFRPQRLTVDAAALGPLRRQERTCGI
jgi:hypothetical protein